MAVSFFGTFLGWLGVALTGSDTSSNAPFGSLQRITSQQLGIDPVLMYAANSAGGVMGKMVDAQSITIATSATEQVGNEGIIFRFVAWHSMALCSIVCVIVLLYDVRLWGWRSSRITVCEIRGERGRYGRMHGRSTRMRICEG
jgi:lactate permease